MVLRTLCLQRVRVLEELLSQNHVVTFSSVIRHAKRFSTGLSVAAAPGPRRARMGGASALSVPPHPRARKQIVLTSQDTMACLLE